MSIKIINGYILPRMSSEDLLIFCNKLRPLFLEKKKELVRELFVRDLVYQKDAILLGIRTEPTSLGIFYRETEENVEKIERTNVRNPLIDFESNVVFFPLADKILALFYAERKDMQNVWISQPEVKDYYYWDNYDRPAEISKTEWEQRKKDWSLVLPDFIPPNQRGLSFVFTDLCIFPFINGMGKYVIEHQWSKKDRVKMVAPKLLESDFYKQSLRDGDIDGLSLIHKFNTFKKSPQGEQKLAECLSIAESILPDSYSLEDILNEEKRPSPKKDENQDKS